MKCEECGEKIQYNQYRKHNGKIVCLKCFKKLVEENTQRILALREARKEKRKRMKKKSKKTDSYNPFVGEN